MSHVMIIGCWDLYHESEEAEGQRGGAASSFPFSELRSLIPNADISHPSFLLTSFPFSTFREAIVRDFCCEISS